MRYEEGEGGRSLVKDEGGGGVDVYTNCARHIDAV